MGWTSLHFQSRTSVEKAAAAVEEWETGVEKAAAVDEGVGGGERWRRGRMEAVEEGGGGEWRRAAVEEGGGGEWRRGRWRGGGEGTEERREFSREEHGGNSEKQRDFNEISATQPTLRCRYSKILKLF